MLKRPYLWLTLAVLIVYGQVLGSGFTNLDDYALLVQNSQTFQNPENLLGVFTKDYVSPITGGQYYRPLFAASLIANGAMGGSRAFLFHLTDLLLHLGVVLLLYKFLLAVSGRAHAAFFGALVFAVHPLLAQTVAWIPARNDSLMVLFFLWYLLVYEKSYWQAALAMALALMSKETALLIPIITVLHTALISRDEKKYHRLLWFLPLWASLTALWFLGRGSALSGAAALSLPTMISSVYHSFAAILQYLGKIIFPFDLSTYPVMADLKLVYGFAAILVLAAGFLVSRQKRNRVIIFGAAWFLFFLGFSLIRVTELPYLEVLEHRAYLPMIGILLIILEFDFFQKDWRLSRPRMATVAVLVLGLGLLNVAHARAFRGGLAYWRQAVRTSPSSPFSHKQLGAMLHAAGNNAEAEREYKIAIAQGPEKTLVYNNAGLLYATMGRAREAEIMYRLEIASNPEYHLAHMNLGNLYWEQNKTPEAVREWQEALRLNPNFFPVYRNLAIYYYETDQWEQGIALLRELQSRGGKIDPDLQEVYAPYLK